MHIGIRWSTFDIIYSPYCGSTTRGGSRAVLGGGGSFLLFSGEKCLNTIARYREYYHLGGMAMDLPLNATRHLPYNARKDCTSHHHTTHRVSGCPADTIIVYSKLFLWITLGEGGIKESSQHLNATILWKEGCYARTIQSNRCSSGIIWLLLLLFCFVLSIFRTTSQFFYLSLFILSLKFT